MSDSLKEVSAAISTMTRPEAEMVAARIIKRLAEREPLSSQLPLVHLAVRLEAFAREDKAESALTTVRPEA